MTTSTYTVTGMTCGHCERAIREEVREVAGVAEVQVDLATGLLTVTTEGPADDDAVREAVAEAGYALA